MATYTATTGRNSYKDATGADTYNVGANAGSAVIAGKLVGDTINVEGLSGEFTVSASGRTITLKSADQMIKFQLDGTAGSASVRFLDGALAASYTAKDGAKLGSLKLTTKAVDVSDSGIDATKDSSAAFGATTSVATTYTLTADAPSVTEGASGSKNLAFTLTLDKAPATAVTVNYQTLTTGTATAGDDFGTSAGTVSFAAGQTVAVVNVPVNGDATVESDETVVVKFTGTSLVAAVEATGKITNDDESTAASNSLTVSADSKTGSTAADTFIANVLQNSLGEQVNSLGSGDMISGGTGTDTLDAKVTAGAFVNSGGTSTMPIQPETKSVELIEIEAVNSASFTSNAGGGVNTDVYINAKDMLSVTDIGSSFSDANLVIQNLTTKDDTGHGSARAVSDMTVLMEYTGNSDHGWSESDLSVYFDQDYLTPVSTYTKPSISFQMMNEDAYDRDVAAGVSAANIKHMDGVYIAKMAFKVNGVEYDLGPYLTDKYEGTSVTGGSSSDLQTYATQITALKSALADLKAASANASNAALQSVQIDLGTEFKSDIAPGTTTQRVGTTFVMTMDGSTNGAKNTLFTEKAMLTLNRLGGTVVNNNRYERASETPSTEGKILEINVDLEKVGLAGDGGDLIIGSMNKTSANAWNAVTTTTATIPGIEKFNVTVMGAADKASSLASLHSTNNVLQSVKVVTDAAQTGTYANLTIGNSQTAAYASTSGAAVTALSTTVPSANNANALKDVKTFDASGMKGDVKVFAALTQDTTAKYLNVTDTATSGAADNVAFTYTTGTGSDHVNLWLDAANLDKPGTSTREDLTLTVDTGTGNDSIVVKIDTTTSTSTNSNWYVNQAINSNLKIGSGATSATGQLVLNGNDGNDTIRNVGTGNFAINGGAGDDTVYSDNTGTVTTYNNGRAAWVFNAADSNGATAFGYDVNNLQSLTPVTDASNIVNLKLKVTYKGFESTVDVAGTSATTINDLSINNAIKNAINNNPVLKTLLLAEDGPARTLVVKSLIDGVQSDGGAAVSDFNDIDVSLSSTALTTSQSTSGLALLSNTQANALGFGNASASLVHTANIAAGTAGVREGYDSVTVDNTTAAHTGVNSSSTSDSLIVGGTSTTAVSTTNPTAGGDVIVLSTGASSNEGIGYTGFNNGTDYIVNFATVTAATTTSNTGNQGADYIDFTSYAAKAVYVGATLTAGTAPSATLKETYILLTASSTNPGEYLVAQYTEAGTTDTLVGTIGTIDFGAAQSFVSGNFLLSGVMTSTGVVGGSTTTSTGAGTAAATLAAAGTTTDAGSGTATTYTITAGNYTHTVAGFGSGDKLVFPTASLATVNNTSFTDGIVEVQYASGGTTTVIQLTGIAAATDATIFGTTSFNTAFGAGSLN